MEVRRQEGKLNLLKAAEGRAGMEQSEQASTPILHSPGATLTVMVPEDKTRKGIIPQKETKEQENEASVQTTGFQIFLRNYHLNLFPFPRFALNVRKEWELTSVLYMNLTN
jgi:hypothetical protein